MGFSVDFTGVANDVEVFTWSAEVLRGMSNRGLDKL